MKAAQTGDLAMKATGAYIAISQVKTAPERYITRTLEYLEQTKGL